MSPLPENNLKIIQLLESKLNFNSTLSNVEDDLAWNEKLNLEVDISLLDQIITKFDSDHEVAKKDLKDLYETNKNIIEGYQSKNLNLKREYEEYKTKVAEIRNRLLDENGSPFLANKAQTLNKKLEEERKVLKDYDDRLATIKYFKQLKDLRTQSLKSLKDNQFKIAAELLLQIEQELEVDRVENESQLALRLKKDNMLLRAKLINSTTDAFDKLINLNYNKQKQLATIVAKNELESLKLEDVIVAQLLLDCLSNTSEKLISFLTDQFINKLMVSSNHFEVTITDEICSITKKAPSTSLKLKNDYVISNLDSLIELFDYLAGSINLSSLTQLLTENYYSKVLSPHILENMLSKIIPSTQDALSQFGPIIDKVTQFEYEVKGTLAVQDDVNYLTEYIKSAESIYLGRKRDSLLATVRSILLDSSTIELIQVGDPELNLEEVLTGIPSIKSPVQTDLEGLNVTERMSLPIRYPKAKIPHTVEPILALIEACLLEATTVQFNSGQHLYFTARSIVDLYLALAPLRQLAQAELGTSYRLRWAALAHNEATFLAHRLLAINLRFQHRLTASEWSNLNALFTFTDFVPPLLQHAQASLASSLTTIRQESLSLLQDLGADGLRDLEIESKFVAAQKQFQTNTNNLVALRSAWDPILPPILAETVIADQLLLPIIDWFVNETLDLIDIGAKDSENLQVLAKHLQLTANDNLPFLANKYPKLKSLNRLDLLADNLLTATLNQIKLAINDGVFEDTFTPTELKHMVLALFAESEKRIKVLELIGK